MILFLLPKKISKGLKYNIETIFSEILGNGFGISEVAEGILERSGRMTRGYFAYSVLSEVATEAEGEGSDEENRNYFRSRYLEIRATEAVSIAIAKDEARARFPDNVSEYLMLLIISTFIILYRRKISNMG